mmetsp:Transcript_2307/g.3436  ORF Transcript_2307/g.3436 Transcript_2307/m.3436 type:complete len:203 (+) Transcript_2307:67-675(+)|eukprot:jgi/Bigna1/135254/aug1.28_g9962
MEKRPRTQPPLTKRNKPNNRKRKKDRDAPEEVTSQKPVSRFRQVTRSHRYKPRDPRFDENCGEAKPHLFQQAYSFIDDIKNEEEREITKMMKKSRSKNTQSKLRQALVKYKQERKMKEMQEKQRKVKSEWIKKERELVAKGKKPFYLKKTEVKRIMLAEKFLTLKKEGRLDKAMAKRRKKNAAKDHRWMPRKGTTSSARKKE